MLFLSRVYNCLQRSLGPLAWLVDVLLQILYQLSVNQLELQKLVPYCWLF